LTSDRRLVDCRNSFNYLAVARDHLIGGDANNITDTQLRTGHFLYSRLCDAVCSCFRFCLSECIGLRFTATLRHRLCEVGEQHGEPKPERDLAIEEGMTTLGGDVRDEENRCENATD